MAISRAKTWIAGEVLTASDLNSEFNNILGNGVDLWSPATKAADMNGFELILDGDADSSITADTDDRVDIRLGGVDLFRFDGTTASCLNGLDFVGTATGVRTRLAATGETNVGIAIRAKGTGGVVLEDGNGNEVLIMGAGTASAVNEVTISNAATGNGPSVGASGETNVPITLKGKGTGAVILGQATSTDVRLAADQPIADSSGNELVKFTKTASAVNECTVVNAATANRPRLDATGGDSNISLALRSKGTAEIVQEDAAGNNVGWAPRSYLSGLGLANNGSDATNDIDFAVGMCRDSANAVNIVLASALTKQLDAAWAVGTNAGMRATGVAIANTTYHLFVIRRPDTAVVDIAADTSATGANIATNTNAAYTQIRRIGSIVRSGATILAFIQDGDKFVWTAGSVGDVSANNPGTAAVTRTVTVPIGIRVEAILNASVSTASGTGAASLRLSDLSTTDVAATAATSQVSGTWSGAGNTIITNSECRVHTNTSAQIRSRIGLSDANVSIIVGTTGWVDRRGRDD